MRFAALSLVLFVVTVMSLAAAQEQDTRSQITIDRNDKVIRVIQNSEGADGGEFLASNPGCDENADVGVVYAPAPGFVETLVNNTRITSTIALLTNPKDTEGEETLELFDGSLELDPDTLCPANIVRGEEKVTVTEGRTTTTGQTFLYNNANGIGEMAGPVDLQRAEEGASPALDARSSNLAFDVDNDLTTLQGNVVVESEGRTSRSERLDLNEEAGFAVLTGTPATSRTEEGEVRGELIEYDLNSNDVVVRGSGSVQASFNIDLGENEPANVFGGGLSTGISGGAPEFDGSDETDSETDDEIDEDDETDESDPDF